MENKILRKIEDLEKRISKLEEEISKINSTINPIDFIIRRKNETITNTTNDEK